MLHNHTFLKCLIITIFTAIVVLPAWAQHQTSSPYSRYGIGEMRKRGLVYNNSLGGTGIASRPAMNINPVNPASYTRFPEKSFTLDVGLKARLSQMQTSQASQTNQNLNVDYLALGFPVTPWLSFSAGVMPYSNVGYNILQETDDYAINHTGTGGLNQAYFGTGVRIGKNLSLGINGSYAFGKITNDITTDFNPAYSNSILIKRNEITLKELNFNAGAQYQFKRDDWSITLGVALENERNMSSTQSLLVLQQLKVNDVTYQDTVQNAEISGKSTTLPMALGVGAQFAFKGLSIAADYWQADWSQALHLGEKTSNYAPAQSYHLGVEYVPDRYSTRYLDIVHYRVGGFYRQTHLQVQTESQGFQQLSDYGASLGLLLPMFRSSTLINIGAEFGKYGTTNHNLLAENYLAINFGFVFKDIWFRQRKFN